jgi:hypothetical protein
MISKPVGSQKIEARDGAAGIEELMILPLAE